MPYEILVHISAPTTKEGDDLYRDEALAYRNFKSSTKVFLDERDGGIAAPTFRHPRHHALREEKAQETQESPSRTFGLESFSVTEPDSSNQVFRQFETQVILDTQQAIGALDSQISTLTNSFYDGTTLSLTEHRPAKRPRTAKPVLQPFSSGCGDPSAPDSPSSFRSPYAPNTSFSRFDPISSLLPESYGLSKSGGSNSIQRAEEVTNRMEFSPFPTTPQRLRDDFSRPYYTPEDNDAAALLLDLRTGESPAISNMLTVHSPSRNDYPAAGKSKELFRNRLSVPSQHISISSRQQILAASQPVEPNSVNCRDGETPSPSLNHAINNSPGHRLALRNAQFLSKRADGRRATDIGTLASSSRCSSLQDARENGVTRSQPDPGTNGSGAFQVRRGLSNLKMKNGGLQEDQSISERSSVSVEKNRTNSDESNHMVVRRTSMRSLVEVDDPPPRTNSSQRSVCGDVIPETPKPQTTPSRQPDRIGACIVIQVYFQLTFSSFVSRAFNGNTRIDSERMQ